MEKTITTWRIPKAAWIMVSLAVTAEATSNALRAYDLGSHLERLTVHVYGHSVSLAGAVLVLAAIAVSLSQTRAAWVALTPGDTRQRIVSGIAACLLLAISITAMATHILSAQRAKSGFETQDTTAYENAKAAYDAAAADFDKVKGAATPAEVDAEIEAYAAEHIDANIWRRTQKCSDVTKKSSRDECQGVLQLAPKRAAAARKAELEAKLPGLKADVDQHRLVDAAGDAETSASWAWAWIMGLGTVMIATFGPAIFARVETVPALAHVNAGIPANDVHSGNAIPGMDQRPIPPRPPRGGQPIPGQPIPGKPISGKRGRKADGRVVDFSERFRERHGRSPTGSEIRAEFPELPVSTAYDYAGRAQRRA